MLPSPLTSTVAISQPRSGARASGLALLLLGAVLVPTVVSAALGAECATAPWIGTPLGPVLSILVLAAGALLLYPGLRADAVAPALAIGAALPLTGGACAGLLWVARSACASSVPHATTSLLVIQGGAALGAVVLCTLLLNAGREIEPWSGARGVVASTTAALALLAVGVGVAVSSSETNAVNALSVLLVGPVPWAAAIALAGWLRRGPGVAVLVGAALEVAALGLASAT